MEQSQLEAIASLLLDGEEVAGRMICESGDGAIRPSRFFFYKSRKGEHGKERISIPNYIRAYGAEGLLEVVKALIGSRRSTIEYMSAVFAEVIDDIMSNTITPEMPEYEELLNEWHQKGRIVNFIGSDGRDYQTIMTGSDPLFVQKGLHQNSGAVPSQYASAVKPFGGSREPRKPDTDVTPIPRRKATKSTKKKVEDGEAEVPVSSDE